MAGARPMVILTAPVIYSVIIPFVLLDLFVSLYQAVCFPVYGIEKVRRRDYIAYDRKHLSYLNGFEKLNCVYCAYGNGLLGLCGGNCRADGKTLVPDQACQTYGECAQPLCGVLRIR